MSSLNDNIAKTINWVNNFVREECLILHANKTIERSVPLSVSAPYMFYNGFFSDIPVIWVFLKESYDITPSVLKRDSEILNKSSGKLPIFIIGKIESYKIQRLTVARVNFLIHDKVIFLPDLLFIVRKMTKTMVLKEKINDVIPPIAQLMILYHIQKFTLNGLSARQMSDVFNVSYITIKRGMAWLAAQNIIELSGDKEKKVQFKYEGKALWDYCEKHLRNPIESIHQSNEINIIENFELAGETALSHYSMLHSNTTVIAISRKELTKMNRSYKGWDKYGDFQVQTWIYDPKILATGDMVDRLSLYLSLKDHYDERVQIELETMIDEMEL